MVFRFVCIAISTIFVACDIAVGDSPARHCVRVELKSQPEFLLPDEPNGERQRTNIDTVVTSTPAAVAAAVTDWTGISGHGQWIMVKFFHNPATSRFTAKSYGDRHAEKTSVAAKGDEVFERDMRVEYKEVLSASDEKTFSVLGILKFENGVTRRACYVICHVEGEKPAPTNPQVGIIQPKGTATWTGPVVNASSVLFAEDEALRTSDD